MGAAGLQVLPAWVQQVQVRAPWALQLPPLPWLQLLLPQLPEQPPSQVHRRTVF
jgi:hypothetical protein